LLELLAEAVLDAAEREFEVGEDEFAGLAADDGDENNEAAGAGDGVALVRELDGIARFSGLVAELQGDALDGIGDALGGGVARGIASGPPEGEKTWSPAVVPTWRRPRCRVVERTIPGSPVRASRRLSGEDALIRASPASSVAQSLPSGAAKR